MRGDTVVLLITVDVRTGPISVSRETRTYKIISDNDRCYRILEENASLFDSPQIDLDQLICMLENFIEVKLFILSISMYHLFF